MAYAPLFPIVLLHAPPKKCSLDYYDTGNGQKCQKGQNTKGMRGAKKSVLRQDEKTENSNGKVSHGDAI